MITTRSLLRVSAAVEVGTGLALISVPRFVVRALLGADLTGSGVITSRLWGLGLLSLGLASWPEREAPPAQPGRRPFRALLAYNGPATAYLVYLGTAGGYRGIALGPALLFHAVMTVLFLTHAPAPAAVPPLPRAR